jgi:LacI family xylobiose transport system transcriptional regulator
VSVPTVSKVVNGHSQVAAKTRALVEQVLHEQGYRPRGKAAKPAALLELVFHELAGVYPNEIITGVEVVARQHHLAVVVSESQGRQTPRATDGSKAS